eukprot:2665778-Lingulodinium_polyedra.AAC.1
MGAGGPVAVPAALSLSRLQVAVLRRDVGGGPKPGYDLGGTDGPALAAPGRPRAVSVARPPDRVDGLRVA